MDPLYHAAQQHITQPSLFDPLPQPTTKICNKCGIEKNLTSFHLQKRGRDGRRAVCNVCRGRENRERKLFPDRVPDPRKVPLYQQTASHRICIACGIDKPIEAFGINPKGPYGHKPRCTVCLNAESRAKTSAKNALKPVPHLGYKFCAKCGEEKQLREFVPRENQCKKCKYEYHKIREQTPERKKINHIKRQRPEHKEGRSAYYLKTKEAFRERGRAWRKANPEKARDTHQKRKAGKLSAIVEPIDHQAIIAREGYCCYICGKDIDPTVKSRTHAALTFDHKVPLQPRDGEPQGTHTESNLFPAHHCCNVRKSNIPFEQLTDWQRRRP